MRKLTWLMLLLLGGLAGFVGSIRPAQSVDTKTASDAAPVFTSPANPHPLTYVAIRMHMRGVLHKQGHGIIAVNKMMAGLDDSTIDTVAQTVPSAADSAYPLLQKIGTGLVIPPVPAAKATTEKLVQGNTAAHPPPLAAATGGFFMTLLQDIATFFASPQGQSLESALVTMLISLIGGL